MSLKQWRKELKKVATAMDKYDRRVTTDELMTIGQECTNATQCKCAFRCYKTTSIPYDVTNMHV